MSVLGGLEGFVLGFDLESRFVIFVGFSLYICAADKYHRNARPDIARGLPEAHALTATSLQPVLSG